MNFWGCRRKRRNCQSHVTADRTNQRYIYIERFNNQYLNVIFINLNYLVLQPSDKGYYRKVSCVLNVVSLYSYVFVKEIHIITCNHSPVNLPICYLNQQINSVFDVNTIIFYSNACCI